MKVKWLGHASFLITSDSGKRVITDPYTVNQSITYGEVREKADVVTVSHEHGDHNNVKPIQGDPKVIKGAGSTEAAGLKFHGVAVFHDEEGGKARGNDVIFCWEMDGMRVCHLGDLGHPLSDKQVSDVGNVDVLLMPVGGFYTIDAKVASDTVAKLAPKVAIPMHFKTEKCGFPIAGVDDFLKGKKNVTRVDGSEVELKANSLPASTQIIVLKPAL